MSDMWLFLPIRPIGFDDLRMTAHGRNIHKPAAWSGLLSGFPLMIVMDYPERAIISYDSIRSQ